MKIAITTVQVPFITGGAEFLAKNLRTALNEAGHQSEIVTIPFGGNPAITVQDQIVGARMFDLRHTGAGDVEMCIGLKFPAYYMPHDNKVLWMLHQHREAYDLFFTKYGNMNDDTEGNRLREIVTMADNRYLPEAKRIYTIADNVTNRLQQYNGIGAQTLYHPCPGMEKLRCESYGDYLLVPSRITELKRQILAVQALRETKENVKLYIMGRAENPQSKIDLQNYAKEHGLEHRIKFFDFVSEEEKIRLYANARGVVFIPVDEDYGYITLEAMAAHKAAITCTDSGGPLEFVVDGKTGIVAQPTPQSVAEAMDALYSYACTAEKYGAAAYAHLQDMNITWENVVKELTRT